MRTVKKNKDNNLSNSIRKDDETKKERKAGGGGGRRERCARITKQRKGLKMCGKGNRERK